MKSNFKKDLENSHKNQSFLHPVLKDFFGAEDAIDSVGKADWDLKLTFDKIDDVFFELKEDIRCRDTGNVFIEYAQKFKGGDKKRTGVFQSSTATELIYTLHTKDNKVLFVWFNIGCLEEYIEVLNPRKVDNTRNYSEDVNISYGYLVKMDDLLGFSGAIIIKEIGKDEYIKQCS